MADNKDTKSKGKERTPAVDLMLDFMRLHNIIMVNDIVDLTKEEIPGVYYVTSRIPRTRFTYKDELEKNNKEVGKKTDKIEYAN